MRSLHELCEAAVVPCLPHATQHPVLQPTSTRKSPVDLVGTSQWQWQWQWRVVSSESSTLGVGAGRVARLDTAFEATSSHTHAHASSHLPSLSLRAARACVCVRAFLAVHVLENGRLALHVAHGCPRATKGQRVGFFLGFIGIYGHGARGATCLRAGAVVERGISLAAVDFRPDDEWQRQQVLACAGARTSSTRARAAIV